MQDRLDALQVVPGGQERGVPVQVPLPQRSPVVHQLPSSQPSVLSTLTHPVIGLQLSFVHWLSSLQLTTPVGTQLPAAHVSPDVQASPSSHGAVFGTLRHAPVVESQLSVVHGLPSSQSRGAPEQDPPEHTSPVVQRSPSLQAAVLFVLTHVPPPMCVHESVVHGLSSSQSIGVPAQTPPAHTSPVVQLVPSLHERVLFVLTQPEAGSQESSVHGLPSLQVVVLPEQDPLEHTSPVVQAFPSSHVLVLLVYSHIMLPMLEQLSVVHGLPSSQLKPTPAQTPPAQTSPDVQSFPSSQAAVLSM